MAYQMSQPLHVAALLAGRIDDAGFMEAGYVGLTRARDELGLAISYTDSVPPERELLAEALRKLARSGAVLVIAHGGQNNEAAAAVAAEIPGDAIRRDTRQRQGHQPCEL